MDRGLSIFAEIRFRWVLLSWPWRNRLLQRGVADDKREGGMEKKIPFSFKDYTARWTITENRKEVLKGIDDICFIYVLYPSVPLMQKVLFYFQLSVSIMDGLKRSKIKRYYDRLWIMDASKRDLFDRIISAHLYFLKAFRWNWA